MAFNSPELYNLILVSVHLASLGERFFEVACRKSFIMVNPTVLEVTTGERGGVRDARTFPNEGFHLNIFPFILMATVCLTGLPKN